MKLRLQTDFALRVLLYLSFVERKVTVDEIAKAFGISRDHLVKVVQQLATHGYVQTHPGRGGGITLARAPSSVTVKEVVECLEGRHGVLDCVESPEVCPMEPGCRLRKLLMKAEAAFYETLGTQTLSELTGKSPRTGGIHNLAIVSPDR
jgi:Rrf2 family nitric oxide-sensitive transcriptional repressor